MTTEQTAARLIYVAFAILASVLFIIWQCDQADIDYTLDTLLGRILAVVTLLALGLVWGSFVTAAGTWTRR